MAESKKAGKAKTAAEMDKRFDDGESIFDIAEVEVVSRRVMVDFPEWMIKALDQEAARLGIARQAAIKMILDRHFQSVRPKGEVG